MAPRAGLPCLGLAGGHLLQLAARALVPDVTGGQWLRVALDLRWT